MDIAWKGGKLVAATITSKLGGPCEVRYGDKALRLKTRAGRSYRINEGLALAR